MNETKQKEEKEKGNFRENKALRVYVEKNPKFYFLPNCCLMKSGQELNSSLLKHGIVNANFMI